ncbi:ubiquinone biosynthesis accessory factor UbiJ [Aliamphritea hakodatensis]|uniref:ubiquinone biosynthesis accessory factor UbiJ n=1 Tax=Aliamphritea hakodatensis TaxID=2895352 RepID=UPI0022FD6DF9|nr:SCP2 sterol-binding domain-containing protein [Aliamphritea hakodatensis]
MAAELFGATLLTLAEAAVNPLLCRNPDIARRLARLNGKIIAVELTDANLHLSIQPHASGLQMDLMQRDDADVTLSGTCGDFLTLLSSKDQQDAMFGKSIRISGESALATRFTNILKDAALDWEGILASIIGDLPAGQLAAFIRYKANFYLQAGQSLKLNLEEYLKEEIHLLPTRPEIEHFLNQVGKVRQGTDRIEARIAQLQSKLDSRG